MQSLVRALVPSFLILSTACGLDTEPTELAAEPDAGLIHWETESTSEDAHSTHLWIVNRAVDILSRHTDSPDAAAVFARMTEPTCRAAWQQGLFDADYKAPYHDGWRDLYPGASEWTIAWSGASWKSHFYDPDTGENYKGETSPVAKGRALEHAAAAEAALDAGKVAKGCYELGLSLHYTTDLTQPMHTANYTATDWPLRLHGHLEGYAMEIQDDYVLGDWSGPSKATRAKVLQATARTSKALWPEMLGAIEDAYGSRCDPFDDYWFDHEECWQGDARVDAAVGHALLAAQEATAHYLTTFGR